MVKQTTMKMTNLLRFVEPKLKTENNDFIHSPVVEMVIFGFPIMPIILIEDDEENLHTDSESVAAFFRFAMYSGLVDHRHQNDCELVLIGATVPEPSLAGKTFKTLARPQQRRFKDFEVPVIILSRELTTTQMNEIKDALLNSIK